jgi:hypothetical protein
MIVVCIARGHLILLMSVFELESSMKSNRRNVIE